MVSITTTLLAIIFGFMVYVAIPISAMNATVQTRQKVGRFYMSLGARALKQFTLVRRVLSGYDVLPINVDDEQKLLKVTLTGSTLGEDNEYRFNDPDNRIMRVFGKPIALAYEKVPAAVDAELAEWGHWSLEKHDEEGIIVNDDGETKIDPYVEADDSLRLIDPVDVFALVPNSVNPENIKTTENFTLKRFEKYGSGIGLKESLRVMMGFGAGMVGVIVLQYANEKLIGDAGGGGGGAPVVGNETLQMGVTPVDPGLVMDMGVMLL